MIVVVGRREDEDVIEHCCSFLLTTLVNKHSNMSENAEDTGIEPATDFHRQLISSELANHSLIFQAPAGQDV